VFIDTCGFRCYYISVRLRTGGVSVPLNELATEKRIVGINSVLRKLKAGCVCKVFLSREADAKLLRFIIAEAEMKHVPIEWEEDSTQLGRACAVARKTAAAALLKVEDNNR